MRLPRPRTLRGRLALWYAGVMSAVLIAFSASIWFIVVDEDEPDAGELAAHEAPDLSAKKLLVTLAVALPTALGIAVGGGLLITRRALRPLDDVVRTSRELGVDNLAARIPPAPHAAEEIGGLVSSLNSMLDRLAAAVNGMKRFTADASHELRTPITVLMGEIEVTLRRPRSPVELREQLGETLEELGRLSHLIDSLLLLARSDNGELPLDKTEIDAASVTRQVLEPYEVLMAQRKIAFTWTCAGPVPVMADVLWLGRAVANLVDNACKFTPDGGQISVSVSTTDRTAEIVVRDSGPGLPPEERERVFERFYRAKSMRGTTQGFGLGLALAREIARGLGGELSADDTAGAGARFRLLLPAAETALIGS